MKPLNLIYISKISNFKESEVFQCKTLWSLSRWISNLLQNQSRKHIGVEKSLDRNLENIGAFMKTGTWNQVISESICEKMNENFGNEINDCG